MSKNKKNFEEVKAVLFDLDGTLVHTLPGLTQLVNAVRRDFDKPALPEERVWLYIGKGMVNLIHRSLTDSMNGRLDDHIFSLAVSSLQKHVEKGDYDKGTLFPGTKEALELLKKAGLKLAIVTNKPYDMSMETLDSCGIADLFDVVVGGDSAPRPKPAKDPVEMAINLLNVSKNEALMIGDSGNDSGAAKAAEGSSILVRTGWSEGVPLETIAERDDAIILADIPEVAKEILDSRNAQKQ